MTVSVPFQSFRPTVPVTRCCETLKKPSSAARSGVSAFGARGLPAYSRIEAAFLGLRLALRDARRGRIDKTAHHLAAGARAVIASPRTWRSLASPACWKVMWTGQILRRRERQLRRGLEPSKDVQAVEAPILSPSPFGRGTG